jgi:hypothetical protein
MTVVAMVSHRATVPGATFDPRFTWTVHSAPERSTCDLILGMGNGNYMSGMTPPITFRAKDRTTVVYELPPTFPVGAPLPWFVTCKLNGVTWAGGGQWQP